MRSYPLRNFDLENFPGLPYCSACHRECQKFPCFSRHFDLQEKNSVCRHHPGCRWNFGYPIRSYPPRDSGLEHFPDFRNRSAYHRKCPKLRHLFRHFDFLQKNPLFEHYPGYCRHFGRSKYFRLFARQRRFVARHCLHPDPVFRRRFLMIRCRSFVVRHSFQPAVRESFQKTIVILPAPWSACPAFVASSSTELQFALSRNPQTRASPVI